MKSDPRDELQWSGRNDRLLGLLAFVWDFFRNVQFAAQAFERVLNWISGGHVSLKRGCQVVVPADNGWLKVD